MNTHGIKTAPMPVITGYLSVIDGFIKQLHNIENMLPNTQLILPELTKDEQSKDTTVPYQYLSHFIKDWPTAKCAALPNLSSGEIDSWSQDIERYYQHLRINIASLNTMIQNISNWQQTTYTALNYDVRNREYTKIAAQIKNTIVHMKQYNAILETFLKQYKTAYEKAKETAEAALPDTLQALWTTPVNASTRSPAESLSHIEQDLQVTRNNLLLQYNRLLVDRQSSARLQGINSMAFSRGLYQHCVTYDLEQSLKTIEQLIKDNPNPIEFRKNFLKHCEERNKKIANSALDFPNSFANDNSNALYVALADLLDITTFSEKVRLFMPHVSGLLKIDYVRGNTAVKLYGVRAAMHFATQAISPELDTYSFHNIITILDKQGNTVLLPLDEIQSLLKCKEQDFISCVVQLYEHLMQQYPNAIEQLRNVNDSFKKVIDNMALIANKGQTPRQALSTFRAALKEGSIHGKGTEYVAAPVAEAARTEFMSFLYELKQRDPALENSIKAMKTKSGRTLEAILEQELSTDKCVNAGGEILDAILTNPDNHTVLNQLPLMTEQNLADTVHSLRQHLTNINTNKDQDQAVHYSFPSDILKNVLRGISKLTPVELSEFLNKQDVNNYPQILDVLLDQNNLPQFALQTIYDIKTCFIFLTPAQQHALLQHNTLVTLIMTYIHNSDDLRKILEFLDNTQRERVFDEIQKQNLLIKITNSCKNLGYTLWYLTPDQCATVLKTIKEQLTTKIITNGTGLGIVLKIIAPDQYAMVLKEIAKQLTTILPRTELIYVLIELTPAGCEKFLEIIQEQLTTLIKNSEDLVTTIECLNSKKRDIILNALNKQNHLMTLIKNNDDLSQMLQCLLDKHLNNEQYAIIIKALNPHSDYVKQGLKDLFNQIDAPYHDAFLIKYFGKEWLHSNISLLRTLISEKDFNTLLIKIEQPTTIVSHSIFATSTSQKISFDDCIDTINAALKKHPEINKDDKAAQILVLLHEYTKWSLFSTKLYRKEVHNILSNTTLSNQKKISSIIDSIGRINNDPQLQKIFDFIDAQYPNLLEKTVTSVDNIPKKQH